MANESAVLSWADRNEDAFMGDLLHSAFLQSAQAQVVLWVAACAALLAVGIYVVAKVRQGFSESGPGPHHLMTNFRELHSQGELSDDEYRTIKAMLAARLQQELKDKGEEG